VMARTVMSQLGAPRLFGGVDADLLWIGLRSNSPQRLRQNLCASVAAHCHGSVGFRIHVFIEADQDVFPLGLWFLSL